MRLPEYRLPGLDYITGFNDLVQKIIEIKVEESCKKRNLNSIISVQLNS